MHGRRLLRWFLYLGSAGLGILTLAFVGIGLVIGHQVREQCRSATDQYSGGCVEASLLLLQDENQDPRSRNEAVWALGQIGDRRALPVLRRYRTGPIPSTEPWDADLSQHELEKAIRQVDGGLNVTAVIWRHGGDVGR
ncbi:MAG: HEAT repeat domain-containing protein [Kineosporiaceae bacterium]|jgi:hypothetical protein